MKAPYETNCARNAGAVSVSRPYDRLISSLAFFTKEVSP